MPKIRDILGQVSVETAQRKRTCQRSSEPIVMGENCLVIKTGPMNSPQSYKSASARQILDSAWAKLHRLYAELNLQPPPAS
jgi:hypothetical protein